MASSAQVTLASCSLAGIQSAACLSNEGVCSLKPFPNSSALFASPKNATSLCRSRKHVPLRVYSAQRGTQFFRSKKDKEEEEPAPKKPAFGTQLFRFNKKVEEEAEEEEEPAKGTGFSLAKVQDLPGLSIFQRRQADSNTVFVAGATGQTGARVSLELLHAGFKVRAGVTDLEEAQKLAEIATAYGLITKEEAKKLNVVQFDPLDAELTAKAVGNASKVVLSVGESENGPSTKFTNKDALVVIKAAELAKVGNLIVISTGDGSSSDSPIGFFARIFSLFKGQSEDLTTEGLIQKIAETDLNFTVIKAGSTTGVPDSFSSSSNVLVSEEGTSTPGEKISRLQIATVVAGALNNIAITENKVFEISASESAPVKPLEEYFSALPRDQRRENIALENAKLLAEKQERATKAAALAEAEAAKAQALAASKLAKALELEAKQIAEQEARAAALAEKTAAQAEAAKVSVETLEDKVKEVDQVLPKSSSSPFSSFKLPDISPTIKAGTQKFSLDKFSEGIDFNALTSKFPSTPKTIFGTAKGSKSEPEEKPAAKPAPKPAPKSAPKPDPKPAPKPVVEVPSSKRRPLKQRIVKPAVVKSVEPQPQKPVEKKKVLGGLFTQDTIFVDDE